MSLFSDYRARAAKRAEYRRTLDELYSMDESTARDLGVSRYDFPFIARTAVYGS